MADFLPAYEEMIRAEGGYKLTDTPGDLGGQTYAGIARKRNPQWEGWAWVDRGEIPPTPMVRDFYRAGWWTPLQGDAITSQAVASALFKNAVNTSAHGRPRVAIKLAQLAAKVTPDGDLGPRTLAAINAMDQELFLARFTIAQIARYTEICMQDKTRVQAKTNLLGWNNRALGSFPL